MGPGRWRLILERAAPGKGGAWLPMGRHVGSAEPHGGLRVKRYRVKGGSVVLSPENKAFRDIVVGEDCDFQVWGVVKNTIRKF